MTAGEMKFAVLVENIFNNIPQPEYRQLMVECLMVLTMLVDPFKTEYISENLDVDEIVQKANEIFYQQEVIIYALGSGNNKSEIFSFPLFSSHIIECLLKLLNTRPNY